MSVIWSLPKVRVNRQAKVDYVGAILLMAGLLPVLLGFTWVGSKYPWLSGQEIALFTTDFLLLAILLLYERGASDPVLSPMLFSNRVFSTSLVLGVLVSMTMFGSLVFLPVYV